MAIEAEAVQEIPEGFKLTELGLLPEEWRPVRLDELFHVQQGKALSPRTRMGVSPQPFLRTANVLWGRVVLSTLDQMDFSDEEVAKLSLEPGDLLVCEGGETGRTAMWAGELGVCCYQNHIHRLRRRVGDIWPEFYMYWMQAALLMLGLYMGQATKTTIPNLSGARLKSFLLPKPGLDEQRAIARVLSTIQRATEATERVIAAARQLKRSLMRHLFTYGPVPIAEAERVPLKETEIGPVPEHWDVVRLGQVCSLSTGTTPSTNQPRYWGGDIPFIKTSEIANSVLDSAHYYVTQEAVGDYNLRIHPPGAVFLAMYGQGKTRGQVGLLRVVATTSQNTAAILPREEVMPEYLWLYLMGQYESLRAAGALGQISHLTLGHLKDVKMPLPTADEQRLITWALLAAQQKAEAEEKRRAALRELFRTMLHLLMTGQVRVRVKGWTVPEDKEVT